MPIPTDAKYPVVMFSGGKDSVLTALLVKEQYPTVDLLWYRMGSPTQAQAVKQWHQRLGLRIYSYPPRKIYYVPTGNDLHLIKEFDINGQPFPVAVDVTPDRQCGIKLSEPLLPHFNYHWDTTFVGWKDCDTHPIPGGIVPYMPDGYTCGGSRFYAPVRGMSDEDVLERLHTLNTPMIPFDDSIPLCTACFNTPKAESVYCPEDSCSIPTLPWDREKSLTTFQQNFGMLPKEGQ